MPVHDDARRGLSTDTGVLAHRYQYTYDGQIALATSNSNSTSQDTGSVVKQVENIYDDLGQMTESLQSESGIVSVFCSPVTLGTRYVYSDLADGVDSRSLAIIYPDGRQID